MNYLNVQKLNKNIPKMFFILGSISNIPVDSSQLPSPPHLTCNFFFLLYVLPKRALACDFLLDQSPLLLILNPSSFPYLTCVPGLSHSSGFVIDTFVGSDLGIIGPPASCIILQVKGILYLLYLYAPPLY
jgi:hypothetical protein